MSNPIIDNMGNKRWFNKDGKYHRIEGPAVIYNSGSKWWFVNGKRHRLDGPAVKLADGDKFWYENGKQHRSNGPAVENAKGKKEWYLNDNELPKDLHTKLTGDIKDLPLYLGLGFDDYISERLKG